MSGFIEKVNSIFEKLPAIEEASLLFDQENVDRLEALASLNLDELVEDLKKGNYLGKRKLDINLSLNNQNEDEECTYKSATLVLNTGTNVTIDFTTTTDEGDIVVEEIASYTALYTKILNGIKAYNLSQADLQLRIVNYELDVINQTIADKPTMLRLRDTDGTACNIDVIKLEYYNQGNPITTTPTYTWSDTTSSLEVLSNIAPSLLELGKNIKDFAALADKEDEMQYLYDNRNINETLYEVLADLTVLSDNINEILEARALAEQTATYANQIAALNPDVVLLASGEDARVEYSSSTGAFTIYMPTGEKGDKGDPFTIGAMGDTAGRSAYDGASKDFTYLDTSTGMVSFKLSSTVADWSSGFNFLGQQGDDGVGIASVSVVTVDSVNKIRFTKTDGTTNDIIISKALIGLENVNNTSDVNKPISTAQQTALNLKVNTSDVIDSLTSTVTNKPLSANQGRVLKSLIDTINTLLTSDNVSLDSLQEIVDFCEINRETLNALGISNIAGLTTALEGKLSTTGTAASATKLATARTLTLSGDVSGSTTFDGSANKTITVTIADDSHNHIISNIDGLQTALNSKQSTLTSGTTIKTVNGTSLLGSGNITTPTVTLTDSVSTTSSTIGASATAVKTAYDKGVSAYNLANSNSVTTSSVLSALASTSVGSVGSVAFLVPYSVVNTMTYNLPAGTTYAGSNLRYAPGGNGTPSGTWRILGNLSSSQSSGISYRTSVWIRIA